MRRIFLIALCNLFVCFGLTQNDFFDGLMREATKNYVDSNFIKAFELYTVAKEKAITDGQVKSAVEGADKSRKNITKQRELILKSRDEARKEKIKADQLLVKIQEQNNRLRRIQQHISRLTFNEVVREKIPGWKDIYHAEENDTISGIAALQKLDSLNFSGKGIYLVPEDILRCRNLKFLGLENNPGLVWNESASVLSRLDSSVTISISIYSDTELDSLFCSRLALVSIQPYNEGTRYNYSKSLKNRITEILDYLGHARKLHTLSIWLTEITVLPDQIGDLIHLRVLKLSNNKLTILPDKMSNLKLLKELNLAGNELTVLPDWICGFSELSYLNLDSNPLIKLPDCFGNLINLRRIRLYGNKFSGLPLELAKLPALRFLSVSRWSDWNDVDTLQNGKITSGFSLPREIRNWKQLDTLELSGLNIETLPNEIGELDNLKYLDLSGNNLKTLPDSIVNLHQLKFLNLNTLPLEKLPDNMDGLVSLKEIKMFQTKLQSLPPGFEKLKNLERIDAEKARFSKFPGSLYNLTGLKQIDFRNNFIGNITPEIGKLKNLEYIYISGNKLKSLPVEIFALPRLKDIDFSDNELDSIPQILFTKQVPSYRLNEIGQQLVLSKNFKQAEKVFQRSLEMDSSFWNIDAYSYLLYCFLENKKPENVNMLYKQVVSMFKCNLEDIRNYTDSSYSAYQYENAFFTFYRKVNLDNVFNYFWFDMTWCFLVQNKPSEAITEALRIIESYPESLKDEVMLSLAYTLNDQWSLAEALFIKWKKKSSSRDYIAISRIILADINELESNGIIHKDFKKVKDIFVK